MDITTNSKIRRTMDAADARPRDEGSEPNASSLDQVRNILFGREIRDVEGRLEEQIEDSRASLAGRISAFEEFVKKRLEDVTAQIQIEREKRNTDLESFNASLRNALRDLQGQVTALDDATMSKDAAVRQHVTSEIQTVTNRLEQIAKEMRMAIDDETASIRSQKMDKETLVTLFAELTQRLDEDRSRPTHD